MKEGVKLLDPIRHHRRSIRLKGYNYTQPGSYFVTIVTKNREHIFGEIIMGKIHFNLYGRTIMKYWQEIPRNFSNAELDIWTIMPNHIHGIIIIHPNLSTGEASHYKASDIDDASPQQQRPTGTNPQSLAAMIQNFKSISTRRINRFRRTPGVPLWQRDYWERIIRDERELNQVREYIQNNPLQWPRKQENSKSCQNEEY
jgi:putative transposase